MSALHHSSEWQQPRRRRRLAFAITAATVGFAAWALTFHLLVPQKEDPDEGVYLMVARLLNAGYPRSSFVFDQFWLFPQAIGFAFRIFGDSLAVGRLTMVAFSLAGLLGMAVLSRLLGARCGTLAFLIGVIEPYYLLQSRFVMSDVPGAVCVVWAAVTMAEFTRQNRRCWLGASGALTAAALIIKPLTICFAVALGSWLIIHRLREGKGVQPRIRNVAADLAVFLAVGCMVAVPFVDLTNLPGEFQRTVFSHLLEGRQDSPGVLRRLQGPRDFIARCFMWLPFAAIGLAEARRCARGLADTLLIGELGSMALLAEFPPWQNHYTLLSPFVAVFAAVGIENGWRAVLHVSREGARSLPEGQRPEYPTWTTGCFRLGVATWILSSPWLFYNDLKVLNGPANDLSRVTTYLREKTGPGSFVLPDHAMITYLADRPMPPSAMNLPLPRTFATFDEGRTQFERVMTDYNIAAVVFMSQYKADPNFVAWLAERFPVYQLIPGDSPENTAHVFTRR